MLLPLKLSNGDVIQIQVGAATPESPALAPPAHPIDPSLLPRGTAAGPGSQKVLASVEANLQAALALVRGVAAEVTTSLTESEERLRVSEIGLQLSIGFGVEGNVFIASGKADAQLALSLKWSLPK